MSSILRGRKAESLISLAFTSSIVAECRRKKRHGFEFVDGGRKCPRRTSSRQRAFLGASDMLSICEANFGDGKMCLSRELLVSPVRWWCCLSCILSLHRMFLELGVLVWSSAYSDE